MICTVVPPRCEASSVRRQTHKGKAFGEKYLGRTDALRLTPNASFAQGDAQGGRVVMKSGLHSQRQVQAPADAGARAQVQLRMRQAVEIGREMGVRRRADVQTEPEARGIQAIAHRVAKERLPELKIQPVCLSEVI